MISRSLFGFRNLYPPQLHSRKAVSRLSVRSYGHSPYRLQIWRPVSPYFVSLVSNAQHHSIGDRSDPSHRRGSSSEADLLGHEGPDHRPSKLGLGRV